MLRYWEYLFHCVNSISLVIESSLFPFCIANTYMAICWSCGHDGDVDSGICKGETQMTQAVGKGGDAHQDLHITHANLLKRPAVYCVKGMCLYRCVSGGLGAVVEGGAVMGDLVTAVVEGRW